MSETVCIVNPASCAGKTGKRWPDIARRLDAAGLSYTAYETAAPGDGTRLTREALRAGATTVIAVGGDGTIHEVVNGFFDGATPIAPEARLGIVPGGTGSDLIKTLGVPADADGAIARLARGEARAIDLGRVTYTDHQGLEAMRHYINSSSAGMSGAVLARMRELPGFLTGSAAYAVASLATMGSFKPFTCQLVVDEAAEQDYRALMVIVCNGRYFGGGMKVAPEADVADGLLDVLVIKEASLPELLMNFPRIYSGTHLGIPQVEWVRARRVRLSGDPLLLEVDGEQPGRTPALFEVVPGAIRVIT